jgi:hypothetical protein
VTVVADPRPQLLGRARRLEYLTVGWNVIEGVVVIALALEAGSGRQTLCQLSHSRSTGP